MKIRLILATACLVTAVSLNSAVTHAQSLKPLDTLAITGSSIMAKDTAGNLYHIAYRTRGDSGYSSLIISMFDGVNFTPLDSMVLDNYQDTVNLMDARFYKGKLYVTGFTQTDTATKTRYHGGFRWDPSGFDQFLPGKNDIISGEIGILKDTLYIQAWKSPWTNSNPLYWFDGQNAGLKWQGNAYLQGPLDMEVINDTLYYINDGKLYKFESTTPILVDDSVYWLSVDILTTDGTSLYYLTRNLTGKVGYTKYTNGVKTQTQFTSDPEIYHMAYHNGKVWTISKGSNSRMRIGFFEDTIWKSVETYLTDSYWWANHDLISVNNKLYICGTQNGKHVIAEVLESGISTVTGRIYIDINDNCIYDTVDIPLRNLIFVDQSIYSNRSDTNGMYTINVLTGEKYVVRAQASLGTSYTCGPDSLLIEDIQTDSIYTFDFPLSVDTTIFDFGVGIGSGVARRGRKLQVSVNLFRNTYQSADSIEVEVKYDPRLSWTSANPNPIYHSGNQAGFKVKSPGFQKWSTVHLQFLVDENELVVGDTLWFTARITDSDYDTSNNFDTLNTISVGPYDPNIKQSYPANGLEKRVDKVRYTIEFQNIGSAEALNVKVVDTVDAWLPVRYIRVTGTSHPQYYDLDVKNNVLIWTFNGINLPSSEADMLGSMGYITYEAGIAPDFRYPGDTINNRAHIYFDYEDGIATNVASIFIIDTFSSVPDRSPESQVIRIFPNPATQTITIENMTPEMKEIRMYDINGRLVHRVTLAGNERKETDLSQLSLGIYILRSNSGSAYRLIKN